MTPAGTPAERTSPGFGKTYSVILSPTEGSAKNLWAGFTLNPANQLNIH
ncbi:MAG: hypothetical protein AB9891_17830 [Anaerolineaceae bacterium]